MATAITRTETFDFLMDILPSEEIHQIRQVKLSGDLSPLRSGALGPEPQSINPVPAVPAAVA